MTPQIFDSSVLIPWSRGIAYREIIDPARQSGRFLLCTVVWMELYAGTQDRTEKRQLDQMARMLSRAHRVVTPQPRDFYQAGQWYHKGLWAKCSQTICKSANLQICMRCFDCALCSQCGCRTGDSQRSTF